LYIALGGSRKGGVRTYVNLLATMTLCGLWHGASWNYVLWGFYNGVVLALHRVWDRLLTGREWADRIRANFGYRLLAWSAALVQIFVGLVMVRSQSWAGCLRVEGALLGGRRPAWPTCRSGCRGWTGWWRWGT